MAKNLKYPSALIVCLCVLAQGTIVAFLAAPALAAAPTIKSTSFSAVGESTATLEALVDPNSSPVLAHFEYVNQATLDSSGFDNAKTTPEVLIPPSVKGTGDLTAGSFLVAILTISAGTFAAGQSLSPVEGIAPGTMIEQVLTDPATGEPDELVLSKAATKDGPVALTATGAQPLSAEISGLEPSTIYHFRVFARKKAGTPEEATGPDTIFYTLAGLPAYGPCPNDIFRGGEFAPSAALPDCRAYEQATPIDKNGNDALGDPVFTRAAADGSTVTFGSTFGVPGGTGAQSLPFFLASRGPGESGWSTRGALPPTSTGQKGQFLRGWSPNYTETFAVGRRLGNPTTEAIFQLHSDGGTPTQVTAYATASPEGIYDYAGASADGETVLFESTAQLPPTEGGTPIPLARPDAHNVYAWDATTGTVHLASVLNTGPETEETLPKGAVAGPYDWAKGTSANTLGQGGAQRRYYAEQRYVPTDGSVFFTAAGTGQIYQRLNPTAPQSTPGPNGYVEDGHCAEPDKACTIHISATHRAKPDPAGSQPAAFQAASADGKIVFFTSFEKLTEDANTGPEQPEAQIGKASVGGTIEKPDFLPTHALGLATSADGRYLYWADPSKGTIGRANVESGTPTERDDSFIVPGEGECEVESEFEVTETLPIPNKPRYVAVDDEYVYWTNTGLPEIEDPNQEGVNYPVGGGTIGRAKLSGDEASVDPDFVCGASNPQGIAVNESYIYWANAGQPLRPSRSYISRVGIEGDGLDYEFNVDFGGAAPYGVAVDGTHLYYSSNDNSNNQGYLFKMPLTGGTWDGSSGIGDSGIRSLTVTGSHIYWPSESGGVIGRAGLDLSANCPSDSDCEKEFIKIDGKPVGLVTDGIHLYYSVNGEAPTNPGNDLYRRRVPGVGDCSDPAGCLDDLTPDPDSENGADVQGVIGASDDGSRVFFVANGDLDGNGPAAAGDCHTQSPHGSLGTITDGSCSLYLRQGETTLFVARLSGGDDVLNWAPTPDEVLGGTASYNPKTSLVTPEGSTLLFRSSEKLGAYDNHGVVEFYRYSAADESIACITCNPSGSPPSAPPTFSTAGFPSIAPKDLAMATSVRLLSSNGNRAFFETTEALVGADLNGLRDVYEWEAPGSGSCESGKPPYSPLNEGCIYLLSTGKGIEPAFLADASASGDDVFILTRDQLVGRDTDQLRDVYDARVGGGLTAQNSQVTEGCEAEGCLAAPTPPPPVQSAPQFSGPPDPTPRRPAKTRCKKKKHCKHRHGKRHGRRRGSHRPSKTGGGR